MTKPPAPLLDPDLGDAQAAACRAARQHGDLASTAAAVDGAPYDRRWFLLRDLDPNLPRHLFDQLVQAHPGSAIPYLMRGIHAVLWGWQARGTGWGSSVTEEGWRLLRERCELAVADLRYAAQLDPADPTPWIHLMRAGRALSWSMQEAEATFEEGRRRDPECWPLYSQMLEHKLPRWFGSEPEALAFARGVAQGAPPGSIRHAVVIRAHLELFHHHERASREQGRAYGARAEVINELAYARAMSVGSPQHVPKAWSHYLHHLLAEYYWALGMRRELEDELRAIGGRYDPLCFSHDLKIGSQIVDDLRRYANAPAEKRRQANAKQVRSFKLAVLLGALFIGGLFAWSGWVWLSEKMESHFYVVNSTDYPVSVSIDGERARPHPPGQALEYDVSSGEHRIHVQRTDVPGAVLEDGAFERPGPRMLILGVSSLYDVSGAGRYAAATVSYSSGGNQVRDLPMDGRIVTFPEGVARYRGYFPQEQRAGTVLTGVCRRGADGDLPCLR